MRTLIVLFCLSAFLLLAVGAVPAAIPPAAEPPAAEAPAAKPPAADAPAAEPPAAEAPAAEPPVAEAPAAEPPVAEAPAAETPAAEPPAAEPPAAEAPAAEPRAANPSDAEPPATETPPPEDAAAAPPSDASAPGSCKGDFKNQCIDCRTIAICAGEKEPLITKSCAALNPMTPYCNEGLCSSIAPGATCNADFRCSSPGYFPHPENCSKYYLCSAINGSAHEYDCGPNQIYDATKYTCEPRTPLSDCKVIDCSVAPNTYARHPGNPAYYAFCLNMPGHVETIMYKCSNAKTSEFNMQRFSCEFSCPKEGRFPHDDCRRFYECYNTGLSIESSEWACPEGFYYDKRESRCVPGKCK